jgi:hypothetical protein
MNIIHVPSLTNYVWVHTINGNKGNYETWKITDSGHSVL